MEHLGLQYRVECGPADSGTTSDLALLHPAVEEPPDERAELGAGVVQRLLSAGALPADGVQAFDV